MRMKIIERIKELQPSDWPESIVRHPNEGTTLISWLFSDTDMLSLVISGDEYDYEITDPDYIADMRSKEYIRSATDKYNERFPNGH